MSGLQVSDADKRIFDEVEEAFGVFLDKSMLAHEPGNMSIGDLLDQKFRQWTQQKEHDAGIMQAAFEFKKRECMSGIGSPDLYTASVAGYLQGEDVPGLECVPLAHGYSSVVGALLQGIPEADIEYDSGVKELKTHADHVEVILESGGKLLARTVVVTVSLGVLKSGQLHFTPKLPQEKQDAIQKTGFGQVEKCILSFEGEAWEKVKQGIHCLWPPQYDKFRRAVLGHWETWFALLTTERLC